MSKQTQSKTFLLQGPIIDWDIPEAAEALGIKEEMFLQQLNDGRIANWLVGLWLGCHGFERAKDGASGYRMIKEGQAYRLRICTDKISLAPSATLGVGRTYTNRLMAAEARALDGYVLVFTVDLPRAQTWIISKEFAAEMRNEEKLLDSKWSGDAAAIRTFIHKVWDEA